MKHGEKGRKGRRKRCRRLLAPSAIRWSRIGFIVAAWRTHLRPLRQPHHHSHYPLAVTELSWEPRLWRTVFPPTFRWPQNSSPRVIPFLRPVSRVFHFARYVLCITHERRTFCKEKRLDELSHRRDRNAIFLGVLFFRKMRERARNYCLRIVF